MVVLMHFELKTISRTVLTGFLVFGIAISVNAAPGRILDKLEVERADKEAYLAETQTFQSIGMGIALSLAQCEVTSSCDPSVDKDELDTLINELDVRINKLILKQEGGEEDYTEILTAYVDTRENYINYQQQLDEIAGDTVPEATTVEEDSFLQEATETEAAVKEKSVDFSVFEDVGDELEGSVQGDIPEDVILEDETPADLPEDIQ